MRNSNVIFIGPVTFPVGRAMSKRWRYIVDYLIKNSIKSSVLITGCKNDTRNATEGLYGNAQYYNISDFFSPSKLSVYYAKARYVLRSSFIKNGKNFLIFPTLLTFQDYPIYRYAAKLGYKVIFDLVETTYWRSEKVSFFHKIKCEINYFFSKRVYKSAAFFAISERLFNSVKAQYPNAKVCLLVNSVHLPPIVDMKNPSTPLRVLYSGTYATKEGVVYLIQGIEKVREKGYQCELILLGNIPHHILKSYGNRDYIDFKGFVSDEELALLQSKADVLAMVRTNSEFANYGFPFKLSEYLATGRVVLSTDVSDVSNYLEDKKSAYIIPPESSSAVSDALIHIITHPQEAMAVAKAGHQAAHKYFSIDRVGAVFLDFLSKL